MALPPYPSVPGKSFWDFKSQAQRFQIQCSADMFLKKSKRYNLTFVSELRDAHYENTHVRS